MGNTAQQCRLGLFQDYEFAGDLEDSKSASGGILCKVGRHTFVPTSCMCKKQTCVSHSSTESELFLWMQVCEWTEFPRMMSGIWSLMCDIQSQFKNITSSKHGATLSFSKAAEKRVNSKYKSQNFQNRLELSNVDFVSSNVNSYHKALC